MVDLERKHKPVLVLVLWFEARTWETEGELLGFAVWEVVSDGQGDGERRGRE